MKVMKNKAKMSMKVKLNVSETTSQVDKKSVYHN